MTFVDGALVPKAGVGLCRLPGHLRVEPEVVANWKQQVITVWRVRRG